MLIKSLHLKNILSFRDAELELRALNVLIGANASGKSNLIDAVALLRAAPDDVGGFLRRNGPAGAWAWQGPGQDQDEAPFRAAQVRAELRVPAAVAYELKMLMQDDRLHALSENLNHIEIGDDPGKTGGGVGKEGALAALRDDPGQTGGGVRDVPPTGSKTDDTGKTGGGVSEARVLAALGDDPGQTGGGRPIFQSTNGVGRVWPADPRLANATLPAKGDEPAAIELAAGKSVMSAVSHPVNYPALTATARKLGAIRIYRGWGVGRGSAARRPQPTDGAVDFLEEDFSNLALVVNELQGLRLKPSMDEYLQRFYEGYESLHTSVYGNTISLTVNEKGQSGSLPASRLSDGAIRFIALMAILCHPDPPPLICIEEPEIAMHPDSLWLVKELLLAAAERTQIIVTTHSTELVSMFSSDAEAVVVCDRDVGKGTRFRRVSRLELEEWQDFYQQTGKELVVYGLSEMWMSGFLGGVRW